MAADTTDPTPEPAAIDARDGGEQLPGTAVVLYDPDGTRGTRQADDPDRPKLTVLERREQVAVLLRQRVSRRTMASLLGVSVSAIGRDIDTVRAGWRERAADSYDAHVAEELAKLDEVERVWRPVMLDVEGDPQMATAAALILDRAARHRMRLLGLEYRKPIEAEQDDEARQSLEQKRAEAYALLDEFTERRLRAAEAEAEAQERAARLAEGRYGYDDDEVIDVEESGR